MTDPVSFVVHGTAVPQGSLSRGSHGGLYHSNPNLRDWRSAISQEAGRAMEGRRLMEGALRLSLLFVSRRPDSHFTTKGDLSAAGRRMPFPARRPDLDKLERAVCDALTKIVYGDDSQICQKGSQKLWAGDGDGERLEVRIEPVPFRLSGGGDLMRLERLRAAIGEDHAADLDEQEQLQAVLRNLEPDDSCPCGRGRRELLALWCPDCGEPTYSTYVTPSHGLLMRPRAGVKTPLFAENGATG